MALRRNKDYLWLRFKLHESFRSRYDLLRQINGLRRFRPQSQSNVGLGGCELPLKGAAAEIRAQRAEKRAPNRLRRCLRRLIARACERDCAGLPPKFLQKIAVEYDLAAWEVS